VAGAVGWAPGPLVAGSAPGSGPRGGGAAGRRARWRRAAHPDPPGVPLRTGAGAGRGPGAGRRVVAGAGPGPGVATGGPRRAGGVRRPRGGGAPARRRDAPVDRSTTASAGATGRGRRPPGGIPGAWRGGSVPARVVPAVARHVGATLLRTPTGTGLALSRLPRGPRR